MTPSACATTGPTETNTNVGTTDLVDGMTSDREEDTRHCPDPTCHGSLTLIDDGDRAVCRSCRCTPKGIYIPPDEHTRRHIEPRGTVLPDRNPQGKRYENGWADDPRERYRGSRHVKLAGGFEDVYDEDDSERPPNVTNEYTFSLAATDYSRLDDGY